MAPSRKKDVGKEHLTRSRSPVSRRRPTRIRAEVPRRVIRRSSTLTSGSSAHRTPIDCLWPSCNATTVHQHHNNLQFFNPHSANESRHRGYVSSHRIKPSHSDELLMRDRDIFGPEMSDDGDAAREQNEDERTSVVGDDGTDKQGEPIERRNLIITLRVAAQEEDINLRRPVASADPPKEQQDVVILDAPASKEYTMMHDGISGLSPGDPITSRRTLDFVEDLVRPLQVTPPHTVPLEIHHEAIAMQEEPEARLPLIEPGLQDIFDEWLVPTTPEQASETLPWDS